MPRGTKAPKLWPAEPCELELDRVVGQARRRRSLRVSSLPRIVPTVRLTLRIGRSSSTGSPRSRAGAASGSERRHVERLVEAVVLLDDLADGDARGRRRAGRRSC